MKKNYTVLFLLLLALYSFPKTAVGQDYSWWNTYQNRDGVTAWNNYMIYSPSYFRPNALPVPFSEKGEVQNRIFIRFYADFHLHKSVLGVSLNSYSSYIDNDTIIIINSEKPVAFNDRPLVFRAKFEHWLNNWKLGVCY